MNERNQQALETAKKHGYFVKGVYISKQTYRAWKRWCEEQGLPEITIMHWRKGKEVEFDGDTFWTFYARNLDYLPHTPILAPTPELKERLHSLVRKYPHHSADWSEQHIHIHGVSAEDAELIAQEIAAIWNEAKLHPTNLPETHSIAAFEAKLKEQKKEG